jgi:hypothetical protein
MSTSLLLLSWLLFVVTEQAWCGVCSCYWGAEVAEQGLQKAGNLPADMEKQNQHD